MRTALGLLFCAMLALPAFGDDSTIYIDVGQAKIKKSLLALPPLKYLGTQSSSKTVIHAGDELYSVMSNDLAATGLFTMVRPDAYLEDPAKTGLKPAPDEPNGFNFANWKTSGADFLIRAGYTVTEGELSADFYVYHVPQAKVLLAKTYKAPPDTARRVAHFFCNDLLKVLTGKQGMFLTKFVASREEVSGGKSSYKEIYVMDWDGSDQTPITNSKTISISPNWSTAGDKIAYTSYAYHTQSKLRNSDLFIYDLNDHKRYLVSYRKGLNNGAVFLPGDKEIILTLSKDGNPDLYRVALDGTTAQALTTARTGRSMWKRRFRPTAKKSPFLRTARATR